MKQKQLSKQTGKSEPKRLTLLGVEFVYLYLLGIVLAFLGWVVENTAKAVTQGVIDARFHVLPFIFSYSLIVFAFHLLLGSPDSVAFFGKKLFSKESKKTRVASNFIVIAIIFATVFLSELVIGNLWDHCFDVKLWNYSDMPFHVTQYAGLIPTVGYGTGAYLIFRFVYAPALRFVRKKVSYKTAKRIVCTLGVLIFLDELALIVQIVFFHQAHMLWRITF